LFEESLDKYRRGKGLNQKLLQTREPIGTFKRGDPHPTVTGAFFRMYRYSSNTEMWADLETTERERAFSREYYRLEENKQKQKKYQKAYRKTEAGKAKDRRYAKTEKRRNALRKYDKSPKGRICNAVHREKRRALERHANVPLNEREEGVVRQIYAYRLRLQDKLGIPFHVDHIVPLSKGGIHHPLNLQVVPAKWNLSKNNHNTEIWQGL
jgi:hypothetical protein